MVASRIYLVERKDGDIKWYKETPIRRYPVEAGKVELGKTFYVVDPSRFRRRKVRRFLKPAFYQQLAFYKEGNPEPIPFFSSDGLDPLLSGKIMTTVLKEKTVDELQMKQTPSWLLLIAVFGGFIAGAVSMYLGGH